MIYWARDAFDLLAAGRGDIRSTSWCFRAGAVLFLIGCSSSTESSKCEVQNGKDMGNIKQDLRVFLKQRSKPDFVNITPAIMTSSLAWSILAPERAVVNA